MHRVYIYNFISNSLNTDCNHMVMILYKPICKIKVQSDTVVITLQLKNVVNLKIRMISS